MRYWGSSSTLADSRNIVSAPSMSGSKCPLSFTGHDVERVRRRAEQAHSDVFLVWVRRGSAVGFVDSRP
jgi:hypothetical protein